MNVVHVLPYTPRLSGGHSNAIRSFIECQRAKGINAFGVAPVPDSGAGGVAFKFPLAEVASLWNLRWNTLAQTFGISPDCSLLNFHSVNYRFAPLLKDLRRADVPYVLTSHGQLGFQTGARWLKKFLYLTCLDWGPRRAAGIQVLTDFARQRLKFVLVGYSGLILVQGNLVRLLGLAKTPPASRATYGIPEDAFVLMFLGRLDVWVKGLDLLIEAFSHLPAHRFWLVMAGPDWRGGLTELQGLAKRLGCRDRILFTGPVYDDKKWALLRMANVFVSPSRWEAFSIAQAEAMACCLPVVTSVKVNLASDLRALDAALIVPLAAEPLAKAIAMLAADEALRQALGRRGLAWVSTNCDPDRAGSRFQAFYQAVLDRTRCNSR